MNLNTYHNPRMPQFIMVVAIALTAYSFACIASEKDRVTANITFVGGNGIVTEVASDTEIKIRTCVGKLKFPVSALSIIETSSTPDVATVHLTSGDRWVGSIGDNILDDLDIENSEDLIKRHGKIESIRFNSLQNYPFQKPVHYMKFILDDGSQALINPTKIVIPLETEFGRWEIPIGSLRALKFVTPYGSDEPESVIIRLRSGIVQRMQLASQKNYMRSYDSYGNRIKVYHRNITGALSETRFNEASTTEDDENISYIITLKNGETKTVSLPVSILKHKTNAGVMPFITPMIASITSDTNSKYGNMLTTVYGELIPGNIATSEFNIIADNDDGYTPIKIDDLDKIIMNSATIPVPDKWLVWYLKSGMTLIGRFESLDQLLTADDKEIDPNTIFSLSPAEDSSEFVNVTREGHVTTYKTTSQKVTIALLTTGTTISIPWKDVVMVKLEKEITPRLLQTSPVVIERKKEPRRRLEVATKFVPEEDVEQSKVVASENKIETIKLRTAIGTLELNPSIIAKISIDKIASKACVTTIYSDKLITSIPSKSWLEELQNIDDYEFPKDDLFEIIFRESEAPKKSKNSFACRLITGDILYGILPDQELIIKKTENRGESIQVNLNKLNQISLDDAGQLTFLMQHGNVTATPKKRELKTLFWGNTNKIAFKQIEVLALNNLELPPPTGFHLGMTSFLRNEILVEGGEFMQGSNSGMPNESPVHTSAVSSFYMDSTEVTRAQFAVFVNETGYETLAEQSAAKVTWQKPGFIQRQTDPAVCVSWIDAVEYCNWRSKKTKLSKCYILDKERMVETDRTAMGYRLPTEAEWEFAARNRGQNNTYAWENSSTTILAANYHQDSLSEERWVWTNPVQTFSPNGLGIFGLSGNVWEWCEDLYFDMAYSAQLNNNVHNPCITHNSAPGLVRRVMRGGSFKNRINLLRCTSRGSGHPFAFSSHVGFRCVRNAK